MVESTSKQPIVKEFSTASPASGKAKRAAWGAWIGLVVDYFDIYLPIIALAPATIYFFPTGMDKAAATTLTSAVFAASFLGRPIGTFIFGHIADTWGRRKATLIAGFGVSAVTFLTAILPGYRSFGLTAPVLLVVVRLIGGIFMGGQYTGANPLAMELSPKNRRGIVGAFIAAAFPIAYIAVSLVTALMLSILPSIDSSSPYVTWGWRLPFFVGALLSLAFAFYFYFYVRESDVWKAATENRVERRPPLRELFSGDARRDLVQVFILMSGVWLGLQSISVATPALLISYLHQPKQTVTTGELLIHIPLWFTYMIFGFLSQRYGRRKVLMVAALLSAVGSAVSYILMVHVITTSHALVLGIALLGVSMCLTLSPNAIMVAYICERFRTGVRSSGYGIAYTSAVIIPSFYALMLLGLGQVMSYEFTPAVLIAVGGLIVFVGAKLGPETRDVDLTG